MVKDKLYIHDIMFSHAYSSSWYNKPELFEWVRKYDEDYLILTDFSLHLVNNFNNKYKYAWLLESPEITSFAYDYIKQNYNKFDKIFTFSENLLKLSDKFIFIPFGGCWILGEDKCVHLKSKELSIILSSKKSTIGHKLRHQIIKKYPQIDSYGFNNPIENKIIALKDYRFSIIVENCKENHYFTEKLIDCFITGTIPIYWGCPSIGNFFDINGLLIFDTLEELDVIIDSLNEELYIEKLMSIKNNFNNAKKYIMADNFIYEKIKQQ